MRAIEGRVHANTSALGRPARSEPVAPRRFAPRAAFLRHDPIDEIRDRHRHAEAHLRPVGGGS